MLEEEESILCPVRAPRELLGQGWAQARRAMSCWGCTAAWGWGSGGSRGGCAMPLPQIRICSIPCRALGPFFCHGPGTQWGRQPQSPSCGHGWAPMPGPLGAPRAHPVPAALPSGLSPQPCPSPASRSLVSRPVPGSGMNKPVALHNQGCRFSPDGCLRPAAARPPPLPVPGVPGSRARAAGCVARALSPSPSPSPSLPGRLSEAVTGSAKAPQLRSLPPPQLPAVD